MLCNEDMYVYYIQQIQHLQPGESPAVGILPGHTHSSILFAESNNSCSSHLWLVVNLHGTVDSNFCIIPINVWHQKLADWLICLLVYIFTLPRPQPVNSY
jgi:hypothetical protein